METIISPQYLQHLEQHLQQQQQTEKCLHPIELQMERVATQPAFEKLRPIELHVLPSTSKSVKGFPFEFELGREMVQKLGSSTK
jgi:hypothetical protein